MKRQTYSAQRIERYQQLIRVMRALTPHQRRHHLNMEHWGLKTSCGTVMCAAGFAGSDPWFTRRGFKLVWATHPLWPAGGGAGLLYREHRGWDAINQFFGPDAEARAMSHPVFRTPDSVTEVIQAAKRQIKFLRQEDT